MATTDPQLAALRRYARSPEGRGTVAMLERMLAEVDVKLRRSTGEQTLRLQGRAQQLEELLDTVTKDEQTPQRQERSAGGKFPQSMPA